MELDTEKLMPALQRHLEKHQEPDRDEQKPARSYIEGSWNFKMYVDVLHVQSVLPTDDMVNAARAELLERRSSMPGQAGAQGKVADRETSAWGDEPAAELSNKSVHTPDAAADVKQLLAHVAARAKNSPGGKGPCDASLDEERGYDGYDVAQDRGGKLHLQNDVPSAQTTATGDLAAGYTVVKSKAVKSQTSPRTSPKLRAGRNERRSLTALALNPGTESLDEVFAGDGHSSDEEQADTSSAARRRRLSRAHRAAADEAGLSDLEPGESEAFLSRGPIYVDGGDGYDVDDEILLSHGAAHFVEASADPLHDEFEAELQRAAATVSDLATKHVFCFQYGCLVFWGLEPEEQEFFIEFVQDFEDESIAEEEHERDDMTFFYSPPGASHHTRLYNDQVCLSSNSPLEKLSVSFSLAQSTKLMVLETRVENTFMLTRTYPQELAETGHISLSQTAVSKLIGQLFIVKSSVNLESDMLVISRSPPSRLCSTGLPVLPSSPLPCSFAPRSPPVHRRLSSLLVGHFLAAILIH